MFTAAHFGHFASVTSITSITSITSMPDDEDEEESSGEEAEEEEEEESLYDDVPEWDGTVPAEAHPIAVELHRKISLVFGPNLIAGEPNWEAAECSGHFESDEAVRYGMKDTTVFSNKFDVFERHSHKATAEYTTGRTHKKEGILFPKFGTAGEKRGPWDAFTLFHPVPESGTGLSRIELGDEVNIGPDPGGEEGIVVRILRGTKAAG